MNYRHGFHAGNFADVFKHAVLARILSHLGRKEQPFRVIDTHAGAGLYDLQAEEAMRTGEWRDGIGRLRAGVADPNLAEWLSPYLAAVAAADPEGSGRMYPGSPVIALALMRRTDRLVACEREPNAARELAANLRRDRRARAVEIDGWMALNAYVPPKERRGLVVIDPPFEARDEFARLATAAAAAWRKWPTGIYLIWYPIKDRSGPEALARELVSAGISALLRAELDIGARPESSRLGATGLLVINPPWRLDDELARFLPALGSILGSGEGAATRLDWLAGK
ncbi:23S rRNA (adenine(2030)-N(6))-methyltransferase RlmJ [Xanthobacteraceae bacterium Astr-EGSB]|uniref:23S rRNA (adenine(2030)-N(6))-methyltransferase RlmJ n=1 Tax=Astrobacterium formosum TaxID=3069710 RepID=UPI0027B53B0D|nr:23S rRNA (adenine(2030)-N(6))-methyltransferase RlmJ [Xanthobacteraceae bacterium Astr-EGSB]